MNGATCTTGDLTLHNVMMKSPVWANCSTFVELPDGATIVNILPIASATATSLPAGFCTSTCPQYLLSVVKSLPSCTLNGKNISDPSVLSTLCPNAKLENKSGASTLSVFLWSYVVVFVTAVATLF
ncbi:hypothetical protein SPRG_15684 [Saprolegnia parasitica CBS 223.65]|uniref:Uncharacterized protein n=1 Tax=Saprolegnia parasitica (strain CBS 223.65) TaxID=695850 RepID=A0A067BXX6_SAPPC|nr:hypothetical protein SPRG_15684 [Saprolegnia parasitica CBS 223.65]KDO19161.1 hypothetical protein SPRG_15684 [Saprolegnia parasitica CBS 223.65]|eukprot:XP_012210131.1 hypothetical protein SPRG_15684 [Saprolegnia parasitica CBS 223.65]